MRNQSTKLFCIAAVVAAFLFVQNAAAQSSYNWLDEKTLPNWNSRSRQILETKKISADELKRCGVTVRQPSLAQDFLLTKMGWTLVGAAQVHGKTTIVGTANGFDGMCRPLGFIMRVFVGNRVAGTLSPGPTDARTDGSLSNVKITSATTLTAEYVRYRESDALCCPYKVEAVTFVIKPDGANFLLVPESKIQISPVENQAPGASLTNTVWRWQDSDAPTGKTTIDKPENYQIEFKPNGDLGVKADCNGGGGNYKAEGSNISFARIFTTKIFCGEQSLDNRFLQALEQARTFRIEGNELFIEGENGTMKFSKVVRQN